MGFAIVGRTIIVVAIIRTGAVRLNLQFAVSIAVDRLGRSNADKQGHSATSASTFSGINRADRKIPSSTPIQTGDTPRMSEDRVGKG